MNSQAEPAGRAKWDSGALGQLVGQISYDIEHVLPTGDVAELRRLRPGDVGCAAFWKMVARRLEPAGLLPAGGAWRDEVEMRWAALLSGMAEMRGLMSSGDPLGKALAKAEVSERRVLRLLRAHGNALLHAVRTTAHQLASQGVRVDWRDFASLVLSDGGPNDDAVRRRIARLYYSSTARE